MDETTRDILSRYMEDTKSLPNESAKTHRFAGLVSELFPGTKAPTLLAEGIEKVVRVDTSEGTKRRRIDDYYGNAVIEFENSLRATEGVAKQQLREQVSGLWRGGDKRPLLCVASDGINWKTFRPRSDQASPGPDEIELIPLREFALSSQTLSDFWIWLTSLLFREGQVDPTAERFRIDFGATSLAFADALEALRRAWSSVRGSPEAQLALDTWQRYLTVTYGSLSGEAAARPEIETLFLKHTYLASVARLLVWAALSHGRTTGALRDVAEDVLSGRYFQSEGIENLVEEDFFRWVLRSEIWLVVAPVWERMLSHMHTYDLARLGQDVLKGVYQELVDPTDRHDLGEYYTPEWLCERIVAELLPEDEGFVSVIDPACGSGSFLRAVIAHQLRANPKGGDATRLRHVLENVVGIDIHPLAVTIARATYVLSLGKLVKATRRPVQIPVYLADSLFLPTEVRQYELGEVPGYEIGFGGRKVRIAEDLVRAADLFDPAIAACAKVAEDHAESDDESEATLRAYLKQALPGLAKRGDFEPIASGLWRFTEELADLIRNDHNSIWAFVVRNGYRPAMLRQRFDVVIGNPPWLSYRYIADPGYQAEVKKRAVDDYAVAPRAQRLVTQMELATVFLVHALTTFGRKGGQIAFVMPRSILSADQHAKLRERTYKAPVTIEGYWDLWNVRPLFKVPACVVFGTRRDPEPRTSYELPAVEWDGKLPERDISWAEAKKSLQAEEKTARLIYLASRSALSTEKGRASPGRGSAYGGRFRQGATIVPRNLYFVTIEDLSGAVEPDKLYWAETDRAQAELAKPPYRDVRMRGQVEGRFIFQTALSDNLLPFALVNPKFVVLPLDVAPDDPILLAAAELRREGYREMGKWMSEAERVWTEKRGRKASKQSVYERLDYHGELTNQRVTERHLVLYNTAGTNISAARVDREALRSPFVVDHMLYWTHCTSLEEADYLAAILNSATVNDAIKPFQSTGLMGERHVHKKVLDLPIPSFKSSDSVHRKLAKLGAKAARESSAYIASANLPSSLARRRGLVRQAIVSTLKEIDNAVEELLGDA